METFFLNPFTDYVFMQRALIGSFAVCLGAVPVGIFMTLRRMSLTGDAMAHAILPGAAIAYLLWGLSLIGLTLGGLFAGLTVAGLAGWVARNTHLHEDTSLAAFYLISLALGVLVISLKHSNIDLFHVLFGNILALDNTALWLLASIATISLVLMAFLYRPLVIECVDSAFLRRSGKASPIAHYGFLFLLVINLVAGFHALGTLMAIGMMILPAAAARFWAKTLDMILISAILISFFGCLSGLLLSFYFDVPAGPAIVLSLGIVYLSSLFFWIKRRFF
ncbi:metal ABC transporter permease [Porticoccaceae bacterium]|nr:metal ABC transporter permease [Porticoccaceae bacterium]MDA8788640.1 metal ABC transporter permease [Porticoccaceae bacterium]MDB2634369.1 metal ABC transporter permease [Porticoccaceae bacterium]